VRSVTQLISVILALCAFAIALIAGLAAGNPTEHVVGRAVAAMLVCQILGMLIGRAVQAVLDEHLERYRADHQADQADQTEQSSRVEQPEPSIEAAPADTGERLAAA